MGSSHQPAQSLAFCSGVQHLSPWHTCIESMIQISPVCLSLKNMPHAYSCHIGTSRYIRTKSLQHKCHVSLWPSDLWAGWWYMFEITKDPAGCSSFALGQQAITFIWSSFRKGRWILKHDQPTSVVGIAKAYSLIPSYSPKWRSSPNISFFGPRKLLSWESLTHRLIFRSLAAKNSSKCWWRSPFLVKLFKIFQLSQLVDDSGL